PSLCTLSLHDALPICIRTIRRIASEHRFNADPYKTWAAAFRETVKLVKDIARGHEAEGASALLAAWCDRGADRPYGAYCLAGAKDRKSTRLNSSHVKT